MFEQYSSSSPKFFSKMDDDGVVFMPAGVFDLFWDRFLTEMTNEFDDACMTAPLTPSSPLEMNRYGTKVLAKEKRMVLW